MKRYFSHSQMFAVYITKVLKQSAQKQNTDKAKKQRQKSFATVFAYIKLAHYMYTRHTF
jgi:hypothetical protein